MDRISTYGSYQSALLNVLNATGRQDAAQQQYASGKLGSDLKAYANKAEALTATNSLQARLSAYVDANKALASKLEVTDSALGQVSDAVAGARKAVADAVAAGDGSGLMTALQGFLTQGLGALNTQYQGKYLFAGGQTATQPVQASQLSDLTAAPSIASLFKNDNLPQVSRLDDSTTAVTGQLASAVGQPFLSVLKSVEAINQDPVTGPITGQLTQAQQQLLQNTLASFDAAQATVTAAQAQNGVVQKQTDDAIKTLSDRQTTLTGVLGGITDADMADAASRLSLAQTALQASAQVFGSLRQDSLLNLLSRG